jgi:hypothetical protein
MINLQVQVPCHRINGSTYKCEYSATGHWATSLGQTELNFARNTLVTLVSVVSHGLVP